MLLLLLLFPPALFSLSNPAVSSSGPTRKRLKRLLLAMGFSREQTVNK